MSSINTLSQHQTEVMTSPADHQNNINKSSSNQTTILLPSTSSIDTTSTSSSADPTSVYSSTSDNHNSTNAHSQLSIKSTVQSTPLISPNPITSLTFAQHAATLDDATFIAEGIQVFRQALELLLHNSLIEAIEALETLTVYTKNVINYPDEKKYRKIKMSNIHYVERVGHLDGAVEAMGAIGYLPVGDYLRLDESRVQHSANLTLLKELEKICSEELTRIKPFWETLPLRLESSHTFSSVTAAGSHSAIGKRHNMEDDEVIVDSFCADPKQGYFGLYDGHGGRATVDFVVKALHMNLEQYLKRFPDASFSEAFKASYLATDGQLRRQNILRSGTTSVTCVVRQIADKRMLFTANVGDSRAVLCRGSRAVRLTIDHKASLPEEAERITSAGGFIGRNKRVNGVLAISRALGDHMLKENDVVSAIPYCTETELTPADTHILLACDGVWDVMSDQEAVDFVLSRLKIHQAKLEEWRRFDKEKQTRDETKSLDHTDSQTKASGVASSEDIHGATENFPKNLNQVLSLTARSLVREALDRRTMDNVTVMIVAL